MTNQCGGRAIQRAMAAQATLASPIPGQGWGTETRDHPPPALARNLLARRAGPCICPCRTETAVRRNPLRTTARIRGMPLMVGRAQGRGRDRSWPFSRARRVRRRPVHPSRSAIRLQRRSLRTKLVAAARLSIVRCGSGSMMISLLFSRPSMRHSITTRSRAVPGCGKPPTGFCAPGRAPASNSNALRRGCRCRCATAANVRFRHRACVSRLPRGCAPVDGRRGPFVNAPIENFGDYADATAEPSRPTGPRRCAA